jgi:hypothetical protein
MKLNVRHVDDATLKNAPKSLGYLIQRILKVVGAKDQASLDEYLIQKLIDREMPFIMMEICAETGIEAETLLRRETKQEKYYSAKIQEMRSLAETLDK